MSPGVILLYLAQSADVAWRTCIFLNTVSVQMFKCAKQIRGLVFLKLNAYHLLPFMLEIYGKLKSSYDKKGQSQTL